MLDTIIKYIKS